VKSFGGEKPPGWQNYGEGVCLKPKCGGDSAYYYTEKKKAVPPKGFAHKEGKEMALSHEKYQKKTRSCRFVRGGNFNLAHKKEYFARKQDRPTLKRRKRIRRDRIVGSDPQRTGIVIVQREMTPRE